MPKARRYALLLMVSLAVLSMVGAVMAQEATPDAPLITPVACDEPGQLTMWVWDVTWASIFAEAIEDWKANYCPGAEVDLQQQPFGQYWDQVQTAASSGDLPDIFNMSQDRFYFYADNDALLNLQPYLNDLGVDTNVWGTGLVNPYRWGENGDLYAAPVNWDTVGLFYNKDLFDAAGLEYPSADWTWDDFAEAAAALTDPENDVYGAAVYSEYQNGYPNWIAATDTTPVVDAERTRCTLTDPGSIEALTFLKNLYDQGYMPSVSILGGSSADDSFNYWLNGRVAMVTTVPAKIPQALEEATFDWGIAQLPKNPETGISRPILHSVGFVVPATSDVPDLAANLILYLVSDEGQRGFAENAGVGPSNPALQELYATSFEEQGVDIDAFINALPDTQGVTPFAEIWNTMNTELVVNIFDLGMSVEEATQTACDFINTQLPE